ncbi:MmgE/PrpD family protein [Eilatimonas milleporae]|uniref:2-methylcitrate dehydratase PrpD n=1 Tax=Eilatimonas milleporae TaxID=911205 RepID=A0A3M0BYS6_9PROT|nr:MmgE/PrpD family protein [Eilatimonas milleporae]RMB02721.1 2-methylcitrate dehydratase PrpD [Eilatimonas milleporae]
MPDTLPSSTDENPLLAFARWVAETLPDWPDQAWSRALDAFIDIVAVMIPGADEPAVQTVLSAVERWGSGGVTVVGHDTPLSPPHAALVNGTAAHALDFDDNFDPAKAHATAVLAPALIALAEDRDMTGRALLDAYIVGLQIMGRIGQGLNPFHRERGWHATATVGTVGCAAGCARLLGLDGQRAAHAISLATSMAGGFMSQFGTMTKPLHAGLAAEGGVRAALFAEAGMTAGADTLHGKTGMGTLMVGPDLEALRAAMRGRSEHGQTMSFKTRDIGKPLHILEYGLKVKRFPNCGSVHRALDGLLSLRATHGFTADDVTEIRVRAPAAHLRNLMYERPVDPMQAKFSLEYNLAVGLRDGTVGLDAFLPDNIARQDASDLIPLVKKDYVEKLESEFDTEVHVHLRDGRTVSTNIHMPVGSSALPLNRGQLWEKFEGCVQSRLDKRRASAVRDALCALEQNGPVRGLTRYLAS